MTPPRLSLPVIAAAAGLLVLASLVVGHGDLGDRELARTFLELRATRAMAAFMSGAALAIGGVALQALFRNPLVDPSILGTTAGASLGGQLAIVAFQLAPGWARPAFLVPEMVLPIGCLAGAVLALAILLAVIRRTRSELAVLLTGFLLSTLFLGTGALLVSLVQDSFELGRAIVRDIHVVATLLGHPERGQRLASSWQRRYSAVAAALGSRPRRRAIYVATYGGKLFGGTRDSSYGDVLTAAGLIDAAAAAGYRGWPQYGTEQLLGLDPELIVTKPGMPGELCRIPGLDRLRPCRVPGGFAEIEAMVLDDPGLPMLDAAEAIFAAAYPATQ